jgi:triphosphatase
LLLRVRRIGKHYVQTIKATGNSATVDRNEWETEISDTKPDLRVIDGTPLADLITKKLRRGLKPVFETHIRRTRYSLDNNKYAIDLTVDRGKIDSGDGSTPICELELELKRGDKGRLFEIARLLVHAAPTQVSLKSKAERGYEFIDGSKDLPVKANPVQLPIHGNARDSFRAIGFACLKQILDNMPALASADPEVCIRCEWAFVAFGQQCHCLKIFCMTIKQPPSKVS